MNEYNEFDGIVDLSLQVRIPSSFYSAVKQYCSLTNTPINEWFNEEIILAIEALELGPATCAFVDKYYLRNLSSEQRHALMQRERRFRLTEEEIGENE